MTSLRILALAAVPTIAMMTAVPIRAALVDFQDLNVPAQGYYNGADSAGGFTSGGTFFQNTYTPAFGSWSGWSYSTKSDTTTAGFGNQYSAYPGGGSNAAGGVQAGGIFGVAFDGAFFNLAAGQTPTSIRLTNTTYAALSMKNGDSFAKKFGGATGNDADYFSVTLTGHAAANAGGAVTGTPVTFYLADYRSANNALDYIVNGWQSVDLTPLGEAKSVGLSFASSDVGGFGINTPTYVAADNLTTVPEPATAGLLSAVAAGLLARRRRQAGR